MLNKEEESHFEKNENENEQNQNKKVENEKKLDKDLLEIFLKLLDFILNETKKNLSQLFQKKVRISNLNMQVKEDFNFFQIFHPSEKRDFIKVTSAFENLDIQADNSYFFLSENGISFLKYYLKKENIHEDFEWKKEYIQMIKEFFIFFVTQFNNVLSQKLNHIILTKPIQVDYFSSERDDFKNEYMKKKSIYIKYDIRIQDDEPILIHQVLDFAFFEKIITILEDKFSLVSEKETKIKDIKNSLNDDVLNLFKSKGVKISSIYYKNLPDLGVPEAFSQHNIGLLLDLKMQLRIELGRAKMKIKKILNLGEGSVIELNKLAGEPVDLFINKKIIAKGEVVVIDQNFGVRITEIIGTGKRIQNIF